MINDHDQAAAPRSRDGELPNPGSTSATFLVSEPRYALTLFSIFMLAGLAGRNRFCYGTITTASLLFLALFAELFVRGWWAF